ncbi:PREDICTED: NAD(P)H-quinone oxidoreductase subunit O, chloroplastic [Ipomoea nil]|uniref:NAD(P)H-quinone oxidoreductase subunit O, chloroplastic n=1 Tax=Ipomoea nil TaxID=35883 RepID=UPI000900A109|nr:PREDICTED: NAD(P)H-quinone oxidoreductase subunit O, chloroplastic [Ipomoea nil]
MAFSSSFSSFTSPFPRTIRKRCSFTLSRSSSSIRFIVKAEESSQPPQTPQNVAAAETKPEAAASSDAPPPPPPKPKKPVYSMKKGQIVRVDKEKYLNSINYLSVGHPPYYKGLEYIYEDRGEVLDIRIFETGEYALIGWVGVPTAPAWLPTEILIKSDKLNYERI